MWRSTFRVPSRTQCPGRTCSAGRTPPAATRLHSLSSSPPGAWSTCAPLTPIASAVCSTASQCLSETVLGLSPWTPSSPPSVFCCTGCQRCSWVPCCFSQRIRTRQTHSRSSKACSRASSIATRHSKSTSPCSRSQTRLDSGSWRTCHPRTAGIQSRTAYWPDCTLLPKFRLAVGLRGKGRSGRECCPCPWTGSARLGARDSSATIYWLLPSLATP